MDVDLAGYLSIPALWTPDEELWNEQLIAHANRAVATQQFVQGLMSVEEYEDCLSDNGVDVRKAEIYWENGICLR